jgi:hypothetical protein
MNSGMMCPTPGVGFALPKADIRQRRWHVCFGPTSGLLHRKDTHSADHFIGVREHHRECRTLLFDSNCAALHLTNFVNDITHPTGDRM